MEILLIAEGPPSQAVDLALQVLSSFPFGACRMKCRNPNSKALQTLLSSWNHMTRLGARIRKLWVNNPVES